MANPTEYGESTAYGVHAASDSGAVVELEPGFDYFFNHTGKTNPGGASNNDTSSVLIVKEASSGAFDGSDNTGADKQLLTSGGTVTFGPGVGSVWIVAESGGAPLLNVNRSPSYGVEF